MWMHNGNTGSKEPLPFINSLAARVNQAVSDGYTDSFNVTARGLYSISKSRYYRPEQVQVINFYHLEGGSSSGKNTTMYLLETSDGLKGTLIDAYNTYSNADVSKFIGEVEEIRKKVSRHNQHEC